MLYRGELQIGNIKLSMSLKRHIFIPVQVTVFPINGSAALVEENDLNFYPPKSSFRIPTQFSFSTNQDKISFKEEDKISGSTFVEKGAFNKKMGKGDQWKVHGGHVTKYGQKSPF